MTLSITIRTADEADVGAIWRIHTSAIRETCSSHYSKEVIDAWLDHLKPESYASVVRRGAVIVAEQGGEAVGFAHLDTTTGEIPSLYVMPDVQGRGVGGALLAAVERMAAEEKIEVLTLHATLNATDFYESRGWVRGERDIRKITEDIALASVTMQKRLP